MRVGFLASGFMPYDGKSIAIYNELKNMENNEIFVYVFSNSFDKSFSNTLNKQNIKFKIIPYSKLRILRRYLSINKIKKTLKEDKLDLVVYHAGFPLWLAAKLLKIPIIKIYYGENVSELRKIKKAPFQIIWMIESFISSRFSKNIVTISEYLKKEHKKHFGGNPKVCYLGRDLIFSPQGEKIKLKNKAVLTVNRLVEYKGIDEIINAVKKCPGVNLYIIGNPENKKYEQYLKSISNHQINFVGKVSYEDLIKYYRSVKIYLSADNWNPWNMPYLEAQSSGTPIIAKNKGAAKELFENNLSGFLVEDENEMANKIKLVFADKNLYKKMSIHALKFSHKFEWKKTAKEYEKLFKKVLKNSK